MKRQGMQSIAAHKTELLFNSPMILFYKVISQLRKMESGKLAKN